MPIAKPVNWPQSSASPSSSMATMMPESVKVDEATYSSDEMDVVRDDEQDDDSLDDDEDDDEDNDNASDSDGSSDPIVNEARVNRKVERKR